MVSVAHLGAPSHEEERLRAASRVCDDGSFVTQLNLPSMHCGGCMGKAERALRALDHVLNARVNLTTKSVIAVWNPEAGTALDLVLALRKAGFEPQALEATMTGDDTVDKDGRRLLLSVGVAGFAAANIMLLSVSVWSGATDATRQLFHLLSGVIAVPAVAYAGQPFFRSAAHALRHGHLNMDVPISLAVLLAVGMSLVESLEGGAHAYFDASVMLLFFLLTGRYLDHRMRERARHAIHQLSKLGAKGAIIRAPDGTTRHLPVADVDVGMTTVVAAGERFPVDGIVISGESEIDRSIATGESASVQVKRGDTVEAGTLNLSGGLDVRATKTVDQSFLAEVVQMMEAAEQGKARHVRVADRVARLYAPAVHLLALAAFVGWLFLGDGDARAALYVAISVLIITCPCALGLAVPIAQVVGAARLFRKGIMVKDGAAFEKLAHVDTVLFDKTGTLTRGHPVVTDTSMMDAADLEIAHALAQASSHPGSRAVAKFLNAQNVKPNASGLGAIKEQPGYGVEATIDDERVRLGRADWVQDIAAPSAPVSSRRTTVCFARDGRARTHFELEDCMRPDASDAIQYLKERQVELEILSGDRASVVCDAACRLGIKRLHSDQTPAEKISRINALRAEGRHVLMVGDGINDAPALAAAHVSMAPSSGSDVGCQAADLVFMGDSLSSVPHALDTACRVNRIVWQNFALAIGYNCIAVPLAMMGYVTPLIAALAMSGSSILVIANSLRLHLAPDVAFDAARNATGTLDTPADLRPRGLAGVPRQQAT